jgi:hypothetical protein
VVNSRFGTFRILHLAGKFIRIIRVAREYASGCNSNLIAWKKMHFKRAWTIVLGYLHHYPVIGVIGRMSLVVIWIKRSIFIPFKRYSWSRVWIFFPLHNGSESRPPIARH